MRRILKSIMANEEPAGLSTLVNPKCVEEIKAMLPKAEAKIEK